MMLPRTKAGTSAEKPFGAPSNSPMERASFASPNPIALPLDINQIRAKNPNKIGPARKSRVVVPLCEILKINPKKTAE